MDAVFVALGDGTRRRVLELLRAGGARTATQLAGEFPVTRQAIAKHLQVLVEAGLVQSERAGRETRWEVTPEALSPAMAWMADLGGTFDDRLAALQRHLGERRTERGIGIRPSAPVGLPATGPLHIAASDRPTKPGPPRTRGT